MDFLKDYKGSISEKIEAAIKTNRDVLKKLQMEGEVASKFEHYDFTAVRSKRRIRAAKNGILKVRELFRDIDSQSALDNNFVYGNVMIMSGGYNTIDACHQITISAAIWMLDQLNLQDKLENAFPFLPAVDELEMINKYQWVSHPCYDTDLIYAMVELIRYKNEPDPPRIDKFQGTLFSDDAVTKGKGDHAGRQNFDAVMDLIDKAAIRKAVERYEKKVWEFYRITLRTIKCFNEAETKLLRRIETIEKNMRQKALQKPTGPTAVPKLPPLNGSPFSNGLFANDDHYEKQRIERQLNRIQQVPVYTLLALVNDREKLTKQFIDVIPEDLAKDIVEFSVDDPFALSFALMYLLDTDSDIPWLYYGSMAVAYTMIDQLPFDAIPTVFDNKESIESLDSFLYRHRFEGYRWNDIQNVSSEPLQRTKATNLGQLLYSNTGALLPRVCIGLPQYEACMEKIGAEDEEMRNIYRLLLYLMKAQNHPPISLRTYHLTKQEQMRESADLEKPGSDSEDPTVQLAALQSAYKHLKQQEATLRTAVHDENRLRKQREQMLQAMEEESERNRQELAELRELVFTLKNETVSAEEPVAATMVFPQILKGRIVSYGGHPAWIKEMKKLLPNVAFYPVNTTPNKDVLSYADEVWVQTQCISHADYYRIASALEKSNKRMHYFRSTSAQICAEQMASATRTR